MELIVFGVMGAGLLAVWLAAPRLRESIKARRQRAERLDDARQRTETSISPVTLETAATPTHPVSVPSAHAESRESGVVSMPEDQPERRPPPGARPLFHIRYRENFGAEVRRDIFPIRPYATEEGVRAWCYLMGEMRLFKFDRIEAVKEIDSGRDIMARGLWHWCGLPEPERAFADEQPDALKQSPWPENPTAAQFRVAHAVADGSIRSSDVSVVRWSSHRRTFSGLSWPAREPISIDWADVQRVTYLSTAVALTRVEFWRAVLAHRSDEAVPWYVTYADELPLACAVIRACQQAAGRFLSKDLQHLNAALQGIGLAAIDADDWSNVRTAARDSTRDLTEDERAAFASCMLAIAEGKPTETAEKLRRAGSA